MVLVQKRAGRSAELTILTVFSNRVYLYSPRHFTIGVRQLKSSIHRNIINVNIMTEHSKKLLSCRSASYVIAKGKTNGIREQGRVELSMFFYTDFIDKQNFRPSEG